MVALIISIKPKYVDRILSGQKTVELRKRSARIRPGTRVLIYSTSPRCAVVGEARISFREQLPIDELWLRHGADAAVDSTEFDDYYAEADEGVALGLEEVLRYPQAVPLDTLRNADDGFRPPQSYMRTPAFIERLIASLIPSPGRIPDA